MINAAEAKQISDDHPNNVYKESLSVISNSIVKEANLGNYSTEITLDIPLEQYRKLEKYILDCGYFIAARPKYDGYNITICWN